MIKDWVFLLPIHWIRTHTFDFKERIRKEIFYIIPYIGDKQTKKAKEKIYQKIKHVHLYINTQTQIYLINENAVTNIAPAVLHTINLSINNLLQYTLISRCQLEGRHLGKCEL